MTVAGAHDARERRQAPWLRKVRGDGILHAMYSRMDVVAAFKPRGQLWVRTATTQIDDQISRDRNSARLVRDLMDEVEHQVDACGNARARVSFAVFNIETIFENSSPRRDPTKFMVAQVVRGTGMSIKKAGAGSDQRASADRDQLVAGTDRGLQPRHDGSFRLFVGCRLSHTMCASAQHYVLHIAGKHHPRLRR